MHPPQPERGRDHASFEPGARRECQVRVYREHQHRDPDMRIAPLARAQSSERHGQCRQHQRHHRQAEAPLQLRLQLGITTSEQCRRTQLAHTWCSRGGLGRLYRNQLLLETHDAEAITAGGAFDALAVVERNGLGRALARPGVVRAPRHRRLDCRAFAALYEYIRQIAVALSRARIDHDAPAAEAAKLPRLERRVDSCAYSLIAQRGLGRGGARRQIEIEPGDQSGDGQCQQPHGHRHAGDADPAGLRRRHLAVMVEPAEGQHDPDQQSERQQDRHILRRAQPD